MILFAVISPVTDRDDIVVVAKLVVDVEVSVPTVKLEVDALVRLVWPATVRVPCDVNEEVAVMFPPVIFENIAVIPEIRFEKKLVDVAEEKVAVLLFRLVIVEEEKIGVSVKV